MRWEMNEYYDECLLAKHVGQINSLNDEVAELRCALYDEQHGISYHARDAILQRWQDHGRQLMASHRAQLPIEARDIYGDGCGCNQCEEVRALLTPSAGIQGPPECGPVE